MNDPRSQQKRAASFDEFYAQKIAPYRELYAKSSRGANSKGWLASVSTLVTVAAIILFIYIGQMELIFLVPVVLLCITIYLWYDYQGSESRFNRFFKDKIIGEILEFLLPGATFEPGSGVEEKFFRQSSLYRRKLKSYHGNDLINANYKGVHFQASELITYASVTEDSTEHLFKGLFMEADIAGITGGTYIWPVKNVQLSRTIADEHFERLTPLHQVFHVETGAPVFDKYFAVYSSFPQEAAAILTEERMQGMINLRHQLKKQVRFSFVPGHFYATISHQEDLLEAVDSLDDKDYIKNYFYSILAYPAIINQLKLYEYI